MWATANDRHVSTMRCPQDRHWIAGQLGWGHCGRWWRVVGSLRMGTFIEIFHYFLNTLFSLFCYAVLYLMYVSQSKVHLVSSCMVIIILYLAILYKIQCWYSKQEDTVSSMFCSHGTIQLYFLMTKGTTILCDDTH